jgi:hypothetical protein
MSPNSPLINPECGYRRVAADRGWQSSRRAETGGGAPGPTPAYAERANCKQAEEPRAALGALRIIDGLLAQEPRRARAMWLSSVVRAIATLIHESFMSAAAHAVGVKTGCAALRPPADRLQPKSAALSQWQ